MYLDGVSDIYHVLHTEEEDILSHRKQRGALYRRGVSSKQVDSHCPRVMLHVLVPGKKETEKPYTNHFHISAVHYSGVGVKKTLDHLTHVQRFIPSEALDLTTTY